jgi:beta-galactosidase
VKEGDNVIRVIARNADQPNSRWYSGTGIIRPVWLWQGPEEGLLINGVKIRTLSIKPARIQVKAETSAPGPVKVEIFREGEKAAEAEALSEKTPSGCAAFCQMEIPEARTWSVDHPDLYTCRVSFGEDVSEETFGIRTLKWNAEKGLTVNGKRVILRGACIHHDNGILGGCTYPEAEERKIRILKENGYNAIRSSHYPASKDLLSACDRLGMLVMDEYVDHWYMHKTKYDYAGTLLKWWKQDLKDLVDKDYNHPSVIMYSTGNEVAESAQKKGIDLQLRFTHYLHSLDPSRPVTCGINIFFNFLSSIGLGVYSDDKAEAQAKEAAVKAAPEGAGKARKKSVGSEFYNMLAVKMGTGFMKFGASLPPSDWKTREAFAAMDIAGYNYGINRYKKDLKKYPDRLILGSETFCTDAYAFWEIAKDNPRIIGDFVWTGWDYLGETGLGGAEYSDYLDERPETQMTGGNGRIDLSGKPRCEAYYTRVALEQETGPYIGVYPVYEKKPQFNGWTMSKALRSWSYPGFEGREAEVEVYARADSVELFVNGKSVGKNFLKKDCRTTFKTPYASGSIEAVSYDSYGIEIGRDRLETAGEETLLQIRPESASVKKEGLVFIPMQYTDEKGIWKPMEKHTLKVEVEEGEIMGLGNAAAYFEGNYAQESVPTYFGEALTVVRALGTGPVKVRVSDEKGTQEIVIPLK